MQHDLFPTPIIKGRVEPTQEQYDACIALLDGCWDKCNAGSWTLESGKSTGELPGGSILYDHEEFDWLTHPVMIAAKEYWNWTLRYRRDWHLYIDSMWCNKHETGDTTGEHCHTGGGRSKSHVSVVYYLKKDIAGGHLLFKNPLEQIHRMTPLNDPYDTWGGDGKYEPYDYHVMEAETFDYLIFPSWLMHKTQPAVGDRLAISINVAGFPHDITDGDFT